MAMRPDPYEDARPLSIKLANQIINIANKNLDDGLTVEAIAAGIRHAAANFSAFAHHRTDGNDEQLTAIVEDFIQMFEYYLERHAPNKEDSQTGSGLTDLIERAKNEV